MWNLSHQRWSFLWSNKLCWRILGMNQSAVLLLLMFMGEWRLLVWCNFANYEMAGRQLWDACKSLALGVFQLGNSKQEIIGEIAFRILNSKQTVGKFIFPFASDDVISGICLMPRRSILYTFDHIAKKKNFCECFDVSFCLFGAGCVMQLESSLKTSEVIISGSAKLLSNSVELEGQFHKRSSLSQLVWLKHETISGLSASSKSLKSLKLRRQLKSFDHVFHENIF